MNAYIRIIRPNVCLLASASVFVGALISIQYVFVNVFDVVIAMIATFLICGGGNVINDCFDFKIDKINRPDRPLPKKKMSLKNAFIYFWVLSMLGILISSLVNFTFFNIAIISVCLSSLYAAILKKTPLLGNFAVAFLSSITFISGGVISMSLTGVLYSNIYILSVLAFTTTMGREIYKDIEDMKGDKLCDCKTLPIVVGKTLSKIIGDSFIIVSIFVAISWYFYSTFSIYYFAVLIPCAISLLYSVTTKDIHKAQKYVKIGMYFGIFVFMCTII